MSSTTPSNPYNADYYEHSCGQPYRHDAVWLQFFGFVADHIARDIHPSTVFDAGCAMGFLVECLRQRGIEAWGVDISEYAIQNVQPEIRPYCRMGSILDPLPQRYDLIVCIEIVEHLAASESEHAIRNLCSYTDDILFSSTPFDFTEPTHVNVQPPEYWVELFTRSGFFHDLDFDASFISNWAMRFRKKPAPLAQLVSTYERRLWQLTFENRSLHETIEKQRNELATKEGDIRDEGSRGRERSRHTGAPQQPGQRRISRFPKSVFTPAASGQPPRPSEARYPAQIQVVKSFRAPFVQSVLIPMSQRRPPLQI